MNTSKRLFKEFSFAFCAALVWTIYSLSSVEILNTKEVLTVFGPAFFYSVGQVVTSCEFNDKTARKKI